MPGRKRAQRVREEAGHKQVAAWRYMVSCTRSAGDTDLPVTQDLAAEASKPGHYLRQSRHVSGLSCLGVGGIDLVVHPIRDQPRHRPAHPARTPALAALACVPPRPADVPASNSLSPCWRKRYPAWLSLLTAVRRQAWPQDRTVRDNHRPVACEVCRQNTRMWGSVAADSFPASRFRTAWTLNSFPARVGTTCLRVVRGR